MPFDEPGSPIKARKGEKVTHVGSYKLQQVLGKGSFCSVRLATHIVSGKQVIVVHKHFLVLGDRFLIIYLLIIMNAVCCESD